MKSGGSEYIKRFKAQLSVTTVAGHLETKTMRIKLTRKVIRYHDSL